MKKFIPACVLLAAAAAPIMASADQSAVLKITGLITPAACTPTFTGGDTIDYGIIAAASLSSTDANPLAAKTTQLSIACDRPMKFAVHARDERPGTAIEDLVTFPDYGPELKYGLGTFDGTRIGAYSMKITRASSDVGVARPLLGNPDGTGWQPTGGGFRNTGNLIGFGLGASALEPAGHGLVTLDIGVYTTLDKGSNLPLSEDIPLNGQSTFEVVYL